MKRILSLVLAITLCFSMVFVGTVEASDSTDWIDGYKDYLEEVSNDAKEMKAMDGFVFVWYTLCDMNDDNIPELLLHASIGKTHSKINTSIIVCTYKNNSVVELDPMIDDGDYLRVLGKLRNNDIISVSNAMVCQELHFDGNTITTTKIWGSKEIDHKNQLLKHYIENEGAVMLEPHLICDNKNVNIDYSGFDEYLSENGTVSPDKPIPNTTPQPNASEPNMTEPEATPFILDHSTINGSGSAYGYYQLFDENNQPIKNTKVSYRYSGSSVALSENTDDNGILKVNAPATTQSTTYDLIFERADGGSLKYDRAKLYVTINPLSFSQSWNLKQSIDGSIGAGDVGIEICGAKSKVSFADIEVDGSLGAGMTITNKYENGKRVLDIENSSDAELGLEANVGPKGKFEFGKLNFSVTPISASGKFSKGAVSTIGLSIENYDPNNPEHLAKIAQYLVDSIYFSNNGNIMALKLRQLMNQNIDYDIIKWDVAEKISSQGDVFSLKIENNKNNKDIGFTLVGLTNGTQYTYSGEFNKDRLFYSAGLKVQDGFSIGDLSTNKNNTNKDNKISIGYSGSVIKEKLSNSDVSVSVKDDGREVSLTSNSSDSKSILFAEVQQNKNIKLSYTAQAAKNLYENNSFLTALKQGNNSFITGDDIAEIQSSMLESKYQGKYQTNNSFDRAVTVPIGANVGAGILSLGLGCEFSGCESTQYEINNGTYYNDTFYEQSVSRNDSEVKDNSTDIFNIISEPLQSISNIIADQLVSITNSVADGVKNAAATVSAWGKNIENGFNVTISKLGEAFNMSSAEINTIGTKNAAMPKVAAIENDLNTNARISVASTVYTKANTIGDPYLIDVTDKSGIKVTDFVDNPLKLDLVYTEDDLLSAKVNIGSEKFIGIYYWDSEAMVYVRIEGDVDESTKTVSAKITKSGQYVLGIEKQYTEENTSSWAAADVERAKTEGLFPEILENKDLTEPINRSEFAAVAVKVYEKLSGSSDTYTDVPFGDAGEIPNPADVAKAYALGITNGVGSNMFEPQSNITREDLTTMLCRAVKKNDIEGWTLETDSDYPLDISGVSPYADDANISDYARESVYYMTKIGVVNGMGDNLFMPKSTSSAQNSLQYALATREQAVVMALRIIENN